MKTWAVLAALVPMIGGAAAAATNTTFFMNGEDLLQYCQSRSKVEVGMCSAFIVGVSDGTTSNASYAGTGFCQPVRTTRGALQSLVVTWLAAHPADRPRPAAELITRAFVEAFPCAPTR